MWNVIRMDTRHIAHHSNSASNACQQGKEKWSQKHPEVVNSNLLGQIRFFTQKSCDRLWSTMLWWKPQGILSPAATPHLLVRWRPGRGRQYQGFVMQWIPTAKKQPVTCSDNDKTDQTVFWDDWIFGPIWEPPPQRSPFQAPQPIVIPVLHIQNYSVGRQWHEAGGQH